MAQQEPSAAISRLLRRCYQNVRNALIRAGHSESEAHAIALNALRRWASGEGHVHDEVRQAARAALAEYEQEREHHP